MRHRTMKSLVGLILVGSVPFSAYADFAASAACRPSDTECLRQQGRSSPNYDNDAQPCVGPPGACGGSSYNRRPPPEIRDMHTEQLDRELRRDYNEWRSRNENNARPADDPYGREWYQEYRSRRDELERRRQSEPYGPLDRGYGGGYPAPDPYPPRYDYPSGGYGYDSPSPYYDRPAPYPDPYYTPEPYYAPEPSYQPSYPEPYYPEPYYPRR